jgi:hypothetical protein
MIYSKIACIFVVDVQCLDLYHNSSVFIGLYNRFDCRDTPKACPSSRYVFRKVRKVEPHEEQGFGDFCQYLITSEKVIVLLSFHLQFYQCSLQQR